jgi:hypothetical protein
MLIKKLVIYSSGTVITFPKAQWKLVFSFFYSHKNFSSFCAYVLLKYFSNKTLTIDRKQNFYSNDSRKKVKSFFVMKLIFNKLFIRNKKSLIKSSFFGLKIGKIL